MSQYPPQNPYGSDGGHDPFGNFDRTEVWGMPVNTFNMLLHLSQLLNLAIPSAGLIVPIVLWAIHKDKHPSVDAHGKVVLNWTISALIYVAISFVLAFVLVGFVGFFIVGILGLVFPILGAVKANSGELWPYPLSIPFLK